MEVSARAPVGINPNVPVKLPPKISLSELPEEILRTIMDCLEPRELFHTLTYRAIIPIVKSEIVRRVASLIPFEQCYFKKRINEQFRHDPSHRMEVLYEFAVRQLGGCLPFTPGREIKNDWRQRFLMRDGALAYFLHDLRAVDVHQMGKEVVRYIPIMRGVSFVDCLPSGRVVIGNSSVVRVYTDPTHLENEFRVPNGTHWIFTKAVLLLNNDVAIGAQFVVSHFDSLGFYDNRLQDSQIYLGHPDGSLQLYIGLSDYLNCMCAYDDDRFAVGYSNGTVLTYNAEGRGPQYSYNARVTCMTRLPSNVLVVGHSDGAIHGWDAQNSRFEFTSQEGEVTCLTVLSGGCLASAGKLNVYERGGEYEKSTVTVHLFGPDRSVIARLQWKSHLSICGIRAFPWGVEANAGAYDGATISWEPNIKALELKKPH